VNQLDELRRGVVREAAFEKLLHVVDLYVVSADSRKETWIYEKFAEWIRRSTCESGTLSLYVQVVKDRKDR
jgi:hypothetical protein